MIKLNQSLQFCQYLTIFNLLFNFEFIIIWLKFNIMRNTYDNKHEFPQKSNLNQSKQRQNYTQNNPKQHSYQKNNQLTQNQKISKFIIQTLKKIAFGSSKLLSLTVLKPTQKTLFSTVSILISSFDNSFDEANLNIDTLIDLFKVLGYPHSINKTIFQPVGAPHTWGHCLQMMYWLAELASFHHDIRGHMESLSNEEDLNTILIKAYANNQSQTVREFLNGEIQKKSKIIEDLNYKINTNILAIQNLKKAQKDLSEMQQDQKKLYDVLNRENEQLIQSEQQNHLIKQQIAEMQRKIQESKKIIEIDFREITSLQQEILNQELSVDQVEKIKFQIKQLKQKNALLKHSHNIESESMQMVNNNIIAEYMSLNRLLQSMSSLLRENRYQIQKRNVYFKMPEIHIQELRRFLNNKAEEPNMERIEGILANKDIQEIIEKQKMLQEILLNQLKGVEQKNQITRVQCRQIEEFNIAKEMELSAEERSLNQIQFNLNNKTNITDQMQQSHQKLISQIMALDEEIQQKLNEQNSLIGSLKDASRECQQNIKFKEYFEIKSEQVLQSMKQNQLQYQMSILMMLEERFEEMREVNESLGEFDMSDLNQKDQRQIKMEVESVQQQQNKQEKKQIENQNNQSVVNSFNPEIKSSQVNKLERKQSQKNDRGEEKVLEKPRQGLKSQINNNGWMRLSPERNENWTPKRQMNKKLQSQWEL